MGLGRLRIAQLDLAQEMGVWESVPPRAAQKVSEMEAAVTIRVLDTRSLIRREVLWISS